ncbi:MAG TPA: hypothetical protein VFV50_03330 [Bdellovibrionales bacterium]|nr:hypothetical protein [Bdellovibrionales bacterium]
MITIKWAPAVALLVLASFAWPARANLYNPQIMPLGESEAFMANTGVAESGSSGAVFFNPGALATQKGSKISLSGVAYVFFNYKADSALRVDNTDLPYNADGYNGVPFSVVSTKRTGPWVLGLSVMETDLKTYENKVAWRTPNGSVNILQNLNQSEMWLGGTASRQLTDSTGLGLSAFVIRRTESVTNTWFINNNIDPTGTAGFVTSRTQAAFTGLVLLAGFYQQVDSDTSWGARLRLPSFQLAGSLDSYASVQQLSGGVLTKNEADETGLKATAKTPIDLSLGLSRQLGANMRLLADLGYQLGIDYMVLEDRQSGPVRTAPTLRLNLGMRYDLSENAALRGGFFYNPSAQAKLEEEGDSREDYYHFSAGYQFQEEHLTTGIGVFYQFSRGEVIPLEAPDARSAVSTSSYGAILTSGYVF